MHVFTVHFVSINTFALVQSQLFCCPDSFTVTLLFDRKKNTSKVISRSSSETITEEENSVFNLIISKRTANT